MLKWILTGGAAFVIVLLILFRGTLGTLDTKKERVFALFAMCVFPGLWLLGAMMYDLELMTKVDFCVQCHSMAPIRESIHKEGSETLAAIHYRNNYVPKHKACYQCHADHTPVTGFVKTKLNGMKEAYIEYLGTPREMNGKMTHPFDTANCLHCHEESAKFVVAHEDDLKAIVSKETSCLECHDEIH
jgi:nitrate/TMAO reductase-like tetraheme cytochrome c subunit